MSKELDTLPLFPKTSGSYESELIPKKVTPKTDDKAAVAYWQKCLDIISDNVSPQVFKTWFEPITAYKWQDNVLQVRVPSQFFCEWIEEHYYQLLQETVLKVLGKDSKLQYSVIVEDNKDTLASRTIKLPAFKNASPTFSISNATNNGINAPFNNNLHPRYTFDNFIIGDCNQFAISAAKAVGDKPGTTTFNPLVVYGPTGVGKTHLVEGIGNHIIKNNRNARVLYITGEKFQIDFVSAIQNNKMNEFINAYRSIDVLIVDDIQFFAGKEKTQDNFFHTFNALHQSRKQIILTSDKPPKDLKDVDERLISRFKWGLTVDIQQPDLEMRMAILQRKSEDEGIELPYDVIEFIAQNVKDNIRELEGVLIGLIAKFTFERRELNVDLAKEVVLGIADCNTKPITIDDIKNTVANYFKIPVEVIESKSRKHEIAVARQLSIYLSKQLTPMSLKEIGKAFGGRDHSTVLHSCSQIENYLVIDNTIKQAHSSMLRELKSKK